MARGGDGFLERLIEAIPAGIWAVDAEGRTTFVSRRVSEVMGYAPDEMVGRSVAEFVSEHDWAVLGEALQRIAEARRSGFDGPIENVADLVTHDGTTVRISFTSYALYEDGEYAGSVSLDVSELRDVERQLAESEERFRRLAEGAADAIYRYRLGPEPGLEYVNAAVERITGYTPEEFYVDPGLAVRIVHPDDRPTPEAIATGPGDISEPFVYRLLRKDGTIAWVEARLRVVRDEAGGPVAFEGISRDVTERHHLEEQLRQSQKMEAIGQLAGGVAHDFNNELAAIRLYVEAALRVLGPDAERVRGELEGILWMTESGRALTAQLLAFGRRQVLEPQVLDVNTVVRRSERLLRRLIGEHIALESELDAGPLLVETDPFQLEQALPNLVLNARDAMPDGGTIRIVTRLAAGPPGDLPPGSYASIAVADDGVGIDAEARDHLFEPFFTTKRQGEGSGLGLSTVYGFVRQCGGTAEVASDLGAGTTLTLFLPISAGAAPAESLAAADDPEPGRGETVLVVEDEPFLRELLRAILEEQGYAVLSAESGADALRVAAGNDGPIDVVLTDLLMPGMTGRQLVARLAEAHPETRALFMSGYAADELAGEEVADGFLQKPFGASELGAAIRRALLSSTAG
jgi:PAS domain S-box-containing protein